MKQLLIFVLFAGLLACGDRRQKLMVAKDMSANHSRADEDSFKSKDEEITFKQASIQPERKLIKTGQVGFKVTSVEKTKGALDQLCKDFQAYVSSEQQNNLGDRLEHSITIRVPAANYDALSVKIEALATKMESKSVNVQDVTEEFVDASARLKTKKELSTRYHEILKDAKTVTDILAVESQIGSVQAEIESMEGRLKYLGDQVAFSTLTVTYYEKIGVDYGFASKFVNAIGNGWSNLLEFIIGIMTLWPFVILIGGGYWLFARWRKKRKVQA